MKTCSALSEIGERLGRAFLVTENPQIIRLVRLGWHRGGFRDDPLENRSNSPHSFVQCRGEIFAGRKTEAKCQASQSCLISRNNVRLLLRLDLQTMLYPAEKPVGVVQRQHLRARKKVQFTKRSQRLEHAWFLQERMTRSMDQLQRLHDEFDVANAAASEFYVALQLFGSDNVALDAVLDICNLIQQIVRRALGIDERLMLPEEFVSQLAAARDPARLYQCKPFPGFAESGIIIFHALKRTSQWACRAFRAQAQIDPKKRTGVMRSRKRFENSFSQPVEEFVIGNVRRELAFLAVEKKKVNIRAVIQLAAAKFSEREN